MSETSVVTANSSIATVVADEAPSLGEVAAEYVQVHAKVVQLKAMLKEYADREESLKTSIKSFRTGEVNEVLRTKYGKKSFVIAFKDTSRSIIDTNAVKAEYKLMGKAVPMKKSVAMSFEVIRA